jgi:two-component system nitrate/nitrite response regulator NarL
VIPTLIASPTRVSREVLAIALGKDGRVDVVATVGSGEEALREAHRRHPFVVLLDLPFHEGTITARRLRRIGLNIKVIAFGVSESEREILAWAEAGVVGCLLREATLDEVVNAIELGSEGKTACSPAVAGILFRRFSQLVALQSAAEPIEAPYLTRREREIIMLLAEDLSNKEIAQILSLEVSTVKNHLRQIFRKLNVVKREDAAAWADHYRFATSASAVS